MTITADITLQRKTYFPFWAFSFILPTLFTLYWLFKNSQLPSADAANFLSTALNIYQHFSHDGIINGLISCYLERGFRPIIFPVLSVPFLLLTHGDMYIAYSLFAISCLIASLTYTYLIFRLELSRFSAVLATNLIGLLPLLLVQVLAFYAEGAFFPCVIGFSYHLIKSNFLRERKHVFACVILLSLAITLRPVEAVMHFIFLISLFIYLGWRHSLFKSKEVMIVLALCLTALLLFLIVAAIPHLTFSTKFFLDKNMQKFFLKLIIVVSSLALLSWMMIILVSTFSKKNDFHKTHLLGFVFCSLLLGFLWYYPFAFETFQWVYGTSFGDIAAGTVGKGSGEFFHPQGNFFQELNKHIQVEGRVVVIGITFTAFLSSMYLIIKKQTRIFRSLPVIFLFSILPLPFLEIFLTVQDWSRKVSVAFPVLLMLLLIIGLQRNKFWLPRVMLISILLCLHCFLIYTTTFLNKSYNSFLENTVGYYVRPPVVSIHNPHDIVRDFLTLKARKFHLKNIGIEVNANTIEPVDPFLMVVKVQEANENYSVSYPYINKFDLQTIKQLHPKYDALFLSANVNDMRVSPTASEKFNKLMKEETNPSIKTLYYFLYHYAKNDLTRIGWRVDSCTVVKSACLIGDVRKGERKADCFGCLLVPQL